MKYGVTFIGFALLMAAANFGCDNNKSQKRDTTFRAGRGLQGQNQKPGVPSGPNGPESISQNMPKSAQTRSDVGFIELSNNSTGIYDNKNLTLKANDMARLFLITDIEGQSVGDLTRAGDDSFGFKCGQNQICDVEFKMPVNFVDKNMTLSNATRQTTAAGFENGELFIAFFDSLSGRQPDGSTQSGLGVYIALDPNGSYVKGTHIHLNFWDTVGYVTFDGDLNGNLIKGNIDFWNFDDYKQSFGGNGKISGRLGTFTIDKCQVFKNCQ